MRPPTRRQNGRLMTTFRLTYHAGLDDFAGAACQLLDEFIHDWSDPAEAVEEAIAGLTRADVEGRLRADTWRYGIECYTFANERWFASSEGCEDELREAGEKAAARLFPEYVEGAA